MRDKAHEFFGNIESIGGIPFFIVAEKSFLIAAKVVEPFFDPAYNDHPSVTNQFTYDADIKKEIASKINKLSPDTLESFIKSYQSDWSDMDKIVLDLVYQLDKKMSIVLHEC